MWIYPQYNDLEILSKKYKDNLVVIGLPCNQFGVKNQGLKKFKTSVKQNMGLLSFNKKIKVKGEKQHEIYKWLTNKEMNGKSSSNVNGISKIPSQSKGEFVDYFT